MEGVASICIDAQRPMAKEEIYTIPLWDAIKDEGECPFCFLEHKLEQDIIDYCLSDAYMEDDFRQVTNEKGFCRNHFRQLFDQKNRLGLTLVLQTHVKHMMKQMDAYAKNKDVSKKSLFRSSKNPAITPLYDKLENSCYICERIDQTMDRYFDTFFYLYKKDPTFVEAINKTKGFCMPHFIKLTETGKTKASQKVFNQYMNQTVPIFKDNMERVLEDIQWFINKYDYRYNDEPWKNSKDAAKRGIQKINGTIL